MIQVFISDDFLDRLYSEEMDKEPKDQNPWYQILCRQRELYLAKVEPWTDLGDDDPLLKFSKTYNIKYNDATEYVQSVLENPAKVLCCSSPIFILDIPEIKAMQIQNDYGVICVSTSNLRECPLTIGSDDATPIVNEEGYSWRDIFIDYKSVPSNSLVIIDRYLFNEDTEVDHNGRKNLFDILDAILPVKLQGEYNVSIVIDHTKLNSKLSFKNLSNKINKLKKDLKRNYLIRIDLIGMNRVPYDKQLYNVTHNRRILTNYIFTTAEHGICAFSPNGRSLKTQKITTSVLYSDISRNKRDLPEKLHSYILKFLKDVKSHWIKNSVGYMISINGNLNVCPQDWQSRLLN